MTDWLVVADECKDALCKTWAVQVKKVDGNRETDEVSAGVYQAVDGALALRDQLGAR